MMNLIVQFLFVFCVVVLQVFSAAGQVGVRNNALAIVSLPDGGVPSGSSITKEYFKGFREDPQTNYKPAVPFLSLPVSNCAFSGESYWIGSITTQSYNRGKIGRYYYWDMLGNLQGSHLFLDVAGKGKRGLKLVFPRQRTFF